MSCYYLLNEWRYLTYYLVIILLFRFVGSLIQDRISFFFDSIALYFKVMPLASVTGDLKILWLFGSHYFDIKKKQNFYFKWSCHFNLISRYSEILSSFHVVVSMSFWCRSYDILMQWLFISRHHVIVTSYYLTFSILIACYFKTVALFWVMSLFWLNSLCQDNISLLTSSFSSILDS